MRQTALLFTVPMRTLFAPMLELLIATALIAENIVRTTSESIYQLIRRILFHFRLLLLLNSFYFLASLFTTLPFKTLHLPYLLLVLLVLLITIVFLSIILLFFQLRTPPLCSHIIDRQISQPSQTNRHG